MAAICDTALEVTSASAAALVRWRSDRQKGAVLHATPGLDKYRDTTALELSHPAEREPDRSGDVGLGAPEDGSKVALGVDHRPTPQFGGAGVVEHGADVVVAVEAQGRPDETVVPSVALHTRKGATVAAPCSCVPGVTGAVDFRGMDGPEARSGKGEEDGRVLAHGFVDTLATLEPGPYEVAGVTPVNGGTRRATDLAPGAARFEDDAVGEGHTREAHRL